MKQFLAISLITLLVGCGERPGSESRKMIDESCRFLLEESRASTKEVLGLLEPISIGTFGSCHCGGFHWTIVDARGVENNICLQLLWDKEHRFGIGSCHNKPGDVFLDRDSMEESAIIGMLARWLTENFTLEELVAASRFPDECHRDDAFDPYVQAKFLVTLFETDPERFALALEILACGT